MFDICLQQKTNLSAGKQNYLQLFSVQTTNHLHTASCSGDINLNMKNPLTWYLK